MRSWLPLVIVVALVTLGLWFTESPPTLLTRPTPEQQRQAADLVIRGAETRHYSQEGTLAYRVDAERITFFQFDRRDRAELEQPRMLFYQDDAPKWSTISRRGVAHNHGERVILSGQVRVQELPEGIELRTSRITLKPREEYAETDKVVTITSGAHRTEGRGLRADLKQDRIEILSEVKSHYEPN